MKKIKNGSECFICGAEVPRRFKLKTSNGHVCLGCANYFHNIIDNKNSNLKFLLSSLLCKTVITYSMAKEIYRAFKPIKYDIVLYQEYVEFCRLAMHIALDISDESERWNNAYNEVCSDYLEQISFNQEEIISLVKSIIEKKHVYNHN